jgi:hypothetical protein
MAPGGVPLALARDRPAPQEGSPRWMPQDAQTVIDRSLSALVCEQLIRPFPAEPAGEDAFR